VVVKLMSMLIWQHQQHQKHHRHKYYYETI
jgi:hypothetical protein